MVLYLRFTLTNLAQVGHRQQFNVLYTVFPNAFDITDHILLLQKMSNFSFTSEVIDLITWYLRNRIRYVCYNDFNSDSVMACILVFHKDHV